MVVEYIDAPDGTVERYPAWAKGLQDLGYHRGKVPGLDAVKYYKLFPISGFVEYQARVRHPQLFLVRYRSFPTSQNYSIVNVGNGCGPEGSNIGLDEAARADTNRMRASLLLGLICDAKWDSAKVSMPDYFINNSLWLIDAPGPESKAWDMFRSAMPGYLPGEMFTPEQRVWFCEWMRPYAEMAR